MPQRRFDREAPPRKKTSPQLDGYRDELRRHPLQTNNRQFPSLIPVRQRPTCRVIRNPADARKSVREAQSRQDPWSSTGQVPRALRPNFLD